MRPRRSSKCWRRVRTLPPDDLLGSGSVHLRGVDPCWLPGDLQVFVEVVPIEVLPVQSSLAGGKSATGDKYWSPPVVLLCIPEPIVGVEASVGWKVSWVAETEVPFA